MPTPGDKVKLTAKKETVEGILMPSPDEKVILLKLSTGYNVGFPKKDAKITVLEKAKKSKTISSAKITTQKNLPTISILHTGGTIASRVDYRTGGVVASFKPEDLLMMFPELKNIANIESELIAQMWSDDLRFRHFGLIAKKIEQHAKKGVKGIIVGIGTDNLAVAAAALSFIVEQTPLPVILVGSQRSSDRGSTDAAVNLICAAEFIAKSDFAGVAICMHETENDNNCVILPAAKTYKLHSSRRDAFKAVNAEPIAKIDFKTRTVEFLAKEYPKRSNKAITIKPNMEEKVGLLKIHVNMFPQQFEFFKGYKGLIIEGTGLGHTPGQAPNPEAAIHKKMYPTIKKVIDSGCVAVMTTQCLFGGVNLNVYDKGRDLLNLGVISGKDMLADTALVKLSWLLANYKKDDVKKLMGMNLRGEMNERLTYVPEFVER
ncbi:Glu-tRNA(Gln) amidotransferase subunit GatD [Candidatus Woesearchaeota archaeon]|nr:Glu-tRNA(Gln) amidotransferase subunit GatD [Candidatus Woesearchaeota archaeon]